MVDVASKRFHKDKGVDSMGKLIESHADVAKKFGYTPDSSNHFQASATNYVHKPSGHQLSVHRNGQWQLHGIGVHKSGTGSNDLHQYLKKTHFLQQHESTRSSIKTVLSENGYTRNKGGLYVDEIGSQIKYPLLDGVSYHILESDMIGHDSNELRNTLEPVIQEEKKPILNTKLLKNLLKEAAEFQKLETTKCDQDGGNHPEAVHVKAPGAKEAGQAVAESKWCPSGRTGGVLHDSHEYKNGKCTNCGKQEPEPKKPWKVIDMTNNNHVGVVHASTEKQAKKEMIKAGHDSRFHTVREGEAEEFQMGNDQLVGMTELERGPVNQLPEPPPLPPYKPGQRQPGREDPWESEVHEGRKHNPINQKGSLWKQFKKKLQMEDEDVPSPDELAKASLCKQTNGKDVLDEIGEDASPMSRFNDLQKQGFMKLGRNTPKSKVQPKAIISCNACKDWHREGQHTVDAATRKKNLQTEAKEPKFDQGKEVRAIARERVGQPKSKKIIVSKKFKPEKYKPKFED